MFSRKWGGKGSIPAAELVFAAWVSAAGSLEEFMEEEERDRTFVGIFLPARGRLLFFSTIIFDTESLRNIRTDRGRKTGPYLVPLVVTFLL